MDSDKAPFEGFVKITGAGPRWTGKVELIESKLEEPIHWRKPRLVFVNSMSDLFHEALSLRDKERIFRVMLSSPRHTFQILTKRAKLMSEQVPQIMYRIFGPHWTMPGFIHLGVSVEDQETADERIPHLLRTPAAVRFVSYEPALGPVDFRKWFDEGLECNYCEMWRGTEAEAKLDGNEEDPGFLCPNCGESCAHLPVDERLDQVIIGGESGAGGRPFDLQWARNTIAQCKAAGILCFFKQAGSNAMLNNKRLLLHDRKGGELSELPADLNVREIPNALQRSTEGKGKSTS
jgi:protein gp37